MIRTLTRLSPIGLSSILPFGYSNPADTINPNEFPGNSYEEKLRNQTGMERVKNMFIMDEYKDISHELNSIFQAIFTGGFVGACYGGFIRSRNSYVHFIENNQATVFRTTLEAKEKLQTKVTFGFLRGAFQWGWRLALFTGSYVFITTTISVYRGKSSIYEYMGAGTITGLLYKASHGLRASLVGGALGLVLGTFGGATSLLILRLSGTTMEDVRYWQYKWMEDRSKQEVKYLNDTAEHKNNPLFVEHNLRVKENIEKIKNEVLAVQSNETPTDKIEVKKESTSP